MTTLYETPPPPTPRRKRPVSSKIIITIGAVFVLVIAVFATYSIFGQTIFTATSEPVAPPTPTVTATIAPETVVQQAPPVTVVQAPPVTVVQQAPPPVTVVQQAPAPAPATVYQSSTTADQQVASDYYTAESTIGWWIPQISSKQDSAGAMDRFTISQATYPDVFMVWSNDYSTFQSRNYYVAMVPREFSTAAGANSWCDQQGFTADNCFAKRLSHIDGPAGNSVER